MRSRRHRWRIAAALLAAFVASRGALVARSYDRVANWEEAVFLFSGVDLAERGIAHLFDYQDDLSHGGSIPLTLIAVPWVHSVGWRLDALKGIAVAWSAATLLVLFAVGSRFVSTGFGALLGLLYAASPTSAMLQVTLVGSHPEAVLFMVLALGAYLRTLFPGRDGSASALLLGVACGLATWCSYLAAPLAAALGGFYVARSPRRAFAAAAGAVLGLTPWILQDLVLRPHGAMQWVGRTGSVSSPDAAWSLSGRVAESLAGSPAAGLAALGVLVVATAWAGAACWKSARSEEGVASLDALRPAALLPVACAALLSCLMLAAARPSPAANEGFYYHRYFAPLHFLVFWMSALGVEALARRVGNRAYAVAAASTLVFAVATQFPLYDGSNRYVPNASRDLGQGCAVFGHAEVDRAATDRAAIARLVEITDPDCRGLALHGYGWGVLSRYVRDDDGEALATSLEWIPDPALRARACEGARSLLDGYAEGAITSEQRLNGSVYLGSACPRPAASGA